MSKLPERTCIACKLKFPKKQFFKIVRTHEVQVLFDELGKIDGRSIYVCKKFKCVDRVFNSQKGDMLKHHLKVDLTKLEKQVIVNNLLQKIDLILE